MTINKATLDAFCSSRHRQQVTAEFDLSLPADDRAARAWFLSETAELKHHSAMEEWYAKDKSHHVRKYLDTGIRRLKEPV